jgi:undecaprenyl diphosphate synthase
MHQIKISLFGRTQGVNFRRRLANLANELKLKGYVEKSGDDGLVIFAQGDEHCLNEFLNWCQKGFFPAKIKGMSFEWQNPTTKFGKFKIKKEKSFLADEANSIINLSKEILANEILKLDKENQIPLHVALIADGNRRWAREQSWLPWVGHRKAVKFERLNEIFNECKEIGVKYLSFWAFSTENWSRDEREIDEIFNLIRNSYAQWLGKFKEDGIRFRHIGRKDRLPKDIIKILNDFAEKTKEFDSLNFQLCLDYNGRDDIVRAVNKIIAEKVKEIDEDTFKNYLDTHDIPEPDLIIRTSGEIRTSGIMAYESAYAELYFTNVYFPDFDAMHFKRAILDYAARNRNFGGTNKKIHKINEGLFDPDLIENANLSS